MDTTRDTENTMIDSRFQPAPPSVQETGLPLGMTILTPGSERFAKRGRADLSGVLFEVIRAKRATGDKSGHDLFCVPRPGHRFFEADGDETEGTADTPWRTQGWFRSVRRLLSGLSATSGRAGW